MYYLFDLATAVQEKINVVAIVFVDNAFGASIRDQHLRFESRVIGAELKNPDFANVAGTFGADGVRLKSSEELRGALRTALYKDMPAVIEFPITTMQTPFWQYGFGF